MGSHKLNMRRSPEPDKKKSFSSNPEGLLMFLLIATSTLERITSAQTYTTIPRSCSFLYFL